MSINNIIFDFGGVICDNKGKSYFYELGVDKNDVDFYYENVRGKHIDNENTGKISHEEILQVSCKEFPHKTQLIEYMHDSNHLAGIFPLRKDVLEYISSLRSAGFKTYGITNLSKSLHQSFRQQCLQILETDFDSLFHGVTYSYIAGTKKPGARPEPKNPGTQIYKTFLKDYKIDPSTALFIDDQIVNIETGKTLGIQGIHWTKEDTLETIKQKIANILSKDKIRLIEY